MKQYRCIECFSIFNDNSLESDMLLCPSCGGHLEEGTFEKANTSDDRYANDEEQKRYFSSHNDSASEKKRIHTHYDNLKVSRKAPPEVIRAAYRALSQKHHPDLDHGNADATRIMAIINSSYAILSDSAKRREHDIWIAQKEGSFSEKYKPRSQPRTAEQRPTPTSKPTAPTQRKSIDIFAPYWRYLFYFVVAASFALSFYTNNKPQPSTKPYKETPAPLKPAYGRPNTAPNGSPWPTEPAYVRGYKRLHANGLSKVTVDNSQNDSDVFVKLVSLDGAQAYPVRTFYITAHNQYTLNNVTAGNYDARYRDLNSGRLSRSESFNLEEMLTDDGTKFSHITMTLYKVRHGNMKTYDLSETEF